MSNPGTPGGEVRRHLTARLSLPLTLRQLNRRKIRTPAHAVCRSGLRVGHQQRLSPAPHWFVRYTRRTILASISLCFAKSAAGAKRWTQRCARGQAVFTVGEGSRRVGRFRSSELGKGRGVADCERSLHLRANPARSACNLIMFASISSILRHPGVSGSCSTTTKSPAAPSSKLNVPVMFTSRYCANYTDKGVGLRPVGRLIPPQPLGFWAVARLRHFVPKSVSYFAFMDRR